MVYRCVHCGSIYDTTAHEILKGCKCGSHFFYFIKDEDFREIQEEKEIELSKQEKIEIEDDIREIIGDVDREKPVILNLESIRIQKPGKFEIDLVNLFKGKPVIYKLEEGKYIIDIASSFQLARKKE